MATVDATIAEHSRQIAAAFGVPSMRLGPGCPHPDYMLWTDPDGVTGCSNCMTAIRPEQEPGMWRYHWQLHINGFYDDSPLPLPRLRQTRLGWLLSRWTDRMKGD